jgi:glycosyltransferase involved in cell wall biosynthesis
MLSPESSPLISIIVAVFNGKKTLQQCIDSVANQTYLNKELIVVDGGSNDGTVELLKASQDSISYWISEPDLGIYNAWNKGLSQAKGEWICFLGTDDFFWNENVLGEVVQHLMKLEPGIRVAYAQIMLLNAQGESVYSVGEPWVKIKKQFTQIMCIPHQGVMHRRSLFERHGKFDETFRIAGDYELLLRELRIAEASFIPNLVMTAMRQGGVSSSPENSLALMREVRRAQQMHGENLPSRLWMMVVVRVYLRLFIWRILGESTARKLLDAGRRVMGLPPFWTKT